MQPPSRQDAKKAFELIHQFFLGVLCVLAVNFSSFSQEQSPFTSALANLPARNIGPANMGGRITDVDVVESDPKIMYIAAANGGVWKTTDGGIVWKPIFNDQDTLSIGAIAHAPSKPDVLYVGTGEANPRNSVSWGKGIYTSKDAGKTWAFSGVRNAGHIGRIVVHPKNPEIAYAAVLGHLWGPSEERGLYKTIDGGKTWTNTKYLNENTGFVDVVIDPQDSETLYAAAYPVRRGAFSGGAPEVQTSPLGGLYKTTDAGKTWEKLSRGLPDRPMGRCGISIYAKDPKIVYAVIQTDKTDGPTDNRGQVAKTNEGDVEKGGVFRSDDKGQTWKKLNDLCPRPFYYGKIRVDPSDDQNVFVLGIAFHVSSDGGKIFTNAPINTHADHHDLWIDPTNPDHLILGNDGGAYESKDRGKKWSHFQGLCISQFYAIAVDNRTPYRIYGGLQDNGTWAGPSRTDHEGITLADWKRYGGGDGFQCAVDPDDPDLFFAESQFGALVRVQLKSVALEAKAIKPVPKPGEALYRFNWNTPLVMSPHDPKTLYYAANKVFKSTERGENWKAISGDVTRGKPGPNVPAHTISALAESPHAAGTLLAGCDDGRIHLTTDDGKSWKDLTKNIPGVSGDRCINRFEWSHFDTKTAYVCFSRHRNDDRMPYLFRTSDLGQTWKPVMNNLPVEGPVHCIIESSKSAKLLFCGTEYGLYASFDTGRTWQRMSNGIPKASSVHHLVIHPRERELVVATHSSGIYIVDIAPLEELAAKFDTTKSHLFAVKPVVATARKKSEPPLEAKNYLGANPPFGATLNLWVPGTAGNLAITNSAGEELMSWPIMEKSGFQQFVWNLELKGKLAPPGEYTATLKCGTESTATKIIVKKP